MTRPFDKHLDNDELDGLVSLHGAGVTGAERLLEQSLGEASRHVESCQDCSRKMEMHKYVQGEISRLGAPSKVPASDQCIGEAEWLNVAAGLLPETKTRELMKHAAQCGHCGPLLRNAADIFVDEVAPEEEAVLARLRSARPEWQRNMATKLRDRTQGRGRKESASWWQGLMLWPRHAVVVAGLAAALLVAGWLGSRILRPPSAEQLLAQAYTDHRTLEVRIPGAKYAPMRVERSTGASNLDKSPSLLKAEALIGENLKRNSNDPAWLQAKARADLLDGNYESAITSLQNALETQPDSPTLLTDLGSAFFMRAETAGSAIDYGNAIESLGKSLTKSPDDPIALFNRAIAAERMFLYTQAVGDWEHYLRVEPGGEWADDARKRLAALREKLKQHRLGTTVDLSNPAMLVNGVAGQLPIARPQVEEYQDEAVRHWLRAAFPEKSGDDKKFPDKRHALMVLATILKEKHSDSWLADLLAAPDSDANRKAVGLMSMAAEENFSGSSVSARMHAQAAQRLFLISGNLAGQMRAQFEELYAQSWLLKGKQCVGLAHQLEEALRGRNYVWLQIQLLLQEEVCLSMVADLDGAQRAVDSAITWGATFNYNTLYLRGVGLRAALEALKGNYTGSWKSSLLGLKLYWEGIYPGDRAEQFYGGLGDAAEKRQQWHLALALAREAHSAIGTGESAAFEAMLRYRIANDSAMAGLSEEAGQHIDDMDHWFRSLPDDDQTNSDRTFIQISLAKLESERNQDDRALEWLSAAHSNLAHLNNQQMFFDYYETLGESLSRKNMQHEAEKSILSAVFVSEVALNRLSSDRDRIQWTRSKAKAYRALARVQLSSDARRALETWEWYRTSDLRKPEPFRKASSNLNLAGLDSDSSLPMPNLVSERLPFLVDATRISYAEYEDGMAVWVYDNTGVDVRWISVPSGSLEPQIARFVEQCADPSSPIVPLQENARRLYDLLIAPLTSRVSAKRKLIIEPDGALSSLPWRALVGRDGRYFGDEHVITISSGLTSQSGVSQPTLSSQDRPLIVASPAVGDSSWRLLPLLDAVREANLVSSNFAGPVLLTGTQAKLRTVLQSLPGSAVFHFAGHALASANRSGLVLSGEAGNGSGQLLTADRLKGLRLSQAKLAVLSACSTGPTQTNGFADPDGLVRAFLRAGFSQVVASRWNVDSSVTADFMGMFYQSLMAGKSMPEALQSASAIVRSNPATGHPYYWVAFEGFEQS